VFVGGNVQTNWCRGTNDLTCHKSTETSEAQEAMELVQFRMTTQMVNIRDCDILSGILAGVCRLNFFRNESPKVKKYIRNAKINYFMSKIRKNISRMECKSVV
jgi:hypothetical protein